jgi:hypothetical protein
VTISSVPAPNPAQSWLNDQLAHADGPVSVAALTQAWASLLTDALGDLEASGRAVVTGDQIRPANPTAPTERAHALIAETYVRLLQAEHAGQPTNRPAALADLARSTGLAPAKIETLMCNVSAVVQELGYEFLGAHPPKSNVPVGVRPAVRSALDL